MKKILSFVLCLVILCSFAGCNKTQSSAENTTNSESTQNTEKNAIKDKGKVTFKDSLDREITVENPQKVAALMGSFADMWMLAGGSVVASADDAWDDFKLDMKDAVNIGSTHRPSLEKLLSSNPDFVLASSKLSAHVKMRETLEDANIKVAYFDVNDFNSFLEVFKIFCEITDNNEKYIEYGENQQKKINEILSRNKDKTQSTVLVLRASASSIRAKNSEGTMLGGMLYDFGCKNIADSDSMLLENLNVESIIKANPDKIFIVETGDDIDGIKTNVDKMFDENPLWKELDAYKKGEIHYMDKHLYNLKPNAKFTLAYENLEKILY